MFRVRQIIPKIDYSELIEAGIIPDLTDSIKPEVKAKKKCPYWVYKDLSKAIGSLNFSFFGVYMEFLIKKMISDCISVNWNESSEAVEKYPILKKLVDPNTRWNDLVKDLITLTSIYMRIEDQMSDFDLNCLNKSYGSFTNLFKEIKIMFSESDKSQVTFNSEYSSSLVQGHPDITSLNFVLDVKTTQNFESMREESLLQIFSYIALMRHNNATVNYAGILLPLQKDILLLNVKEWKHEPFLNKLLEVAKANTVTIDQDLLQKVMISRFYLSKVGRTVSKTCIVAGKKKTLTFDKTLNYYIQAFMKHGMDLGNFIPIQLFYSSNITLNLGKITDAIISNSMSIIMNYNLKVYIHAPYTINFCKPVTKKDPNDESFIIEACKKHMEISTTIGCKGVVFHVGKAGRTKVDKALDKMEDSIRKVLVSVSEETPFLLETPAGEGTELVTKIEDFIDFYNRFDNEDKKKIKICLDTCHVWASGYDPIFYLNKWEKACGSESIGLIHFNDSKKGKGSRIDRHAPCGHGTIGMEKLVEVAKWCVERNIDMVTE